MVRLVPMSRTAAARPIVLLCSDSPIPGGVTASGEGRSGEEPDHGDGRQEQQCGPIRMVGSVIDAGGNVPPFEGDHDEQAGRADGCGDDDAEPFTPDRAYFRSRALRGLVGFGSACEAVAEPRVGAQ